MVTQLLKYLTVAALLIAPHAAVLAADAARAAAVLYGKEGTQSFDDANAFERSGTVDEINLAANQVIINDRSYGLGSNVPIYEGNRALSRASIRKGMRLSFKTRPGSQAESGSGLVITEMRVLP